jgi:thiol peroxidase
LESQTLPERKGEAFELDARLTVIGKKLQVNEPAPDFSLDHLDPSDGTMHHVTLADSAGHIRLLNVINSLDTPVCHVETHQWEKRRNEFPPEVVVYTISMDLPYAQERWQKAEKVTHAALSGHRSEKFGQDYGLLIKEWRLLQRAVFVIDGQGRIAYAEYVNDQMQEPNYEAALAAIQRIAGAK